MKNNFLITIFLLVTILFSCDDKNSRPNIVLLISDDQSWTDYSFLGHQQIETPRLDKLAQESLTFTWGYTTAPLCRPALASMITGLYPHQHQVVGNDPVFDESGLQSYSEEWMQARAKVNEKNIDRIKNLETLADLLGNVGYTSLQTGKWWEGHYSNGGFDQGMTHGNPEKGGRHGDEGLTIGREGLDPIYNFINEAQDEESPFFIWYAPFLPHAPHTPPDSLLNKYLPISPTPAVARYWAMCEWFDITCGQLIDYVDQKGLTENTLFVYVTDNGWIQDPERRNRYAPRSKREPYEMGIRTPIMFRWPGEIRPQMDFTNPVSSIDIATTILGICEIEPTDQMQGINVLDQNELTQRETVFAETYAHDFSSVDSSLLYRIAIDLPYKLILPDPENKPDQSPELYNIMEDPLEKTDISASEPEKVQELTSKINEWWTN